MSQYPGNDIFMGADRRSGQPVTLTRFDRARHTCIFGSSRTGKSKLVEHMCRQDITQWPDFRCPMVVLDPHGTLYKNLMAFVSAEGLKEWPIVPVDLSRGDLVVSYNLLRRRKGIDPSIVCRAFVDAILYAWGQANSNQTARLATWLHTLLMLSYEREHTLTEALQVIANPELRRLIVADVQDLVVKSVLQSAEQLKEREFQDRVESTLYRINRFLSGQILRATFCQTGESLDMSEILSGGKILLANLSVEGTHIHGEDAAAFGSVLLTDLWNAVNRRGKREEGEIPPCYVYVDEFQNFVGPTIAKGMAEASGFGLHVHLINQWPSQLVAHGAEVGRLVLDSVLNNAQNKIVFKLEHPDDLEMLTRIMFRQAVDPDRIKDEIISPTVVGYDLKYMKSFSTSTSQGTGRSVTESHSYSTGRTVTESQSMTVGASVSEGTSVGTSEGESIGTSDTDGVTDSESRTTGRTSTTGQTDSMSTSDSDGEQWSSSKSRGTSRSTGTGENRSQSATFNSPRESFQDGLRKYSQDELDEDDRDNFDRTWATGLSVGRGESESEATTASESDSSGSGGSRSRSTGSSRGRSDTTGRSEADSKGHAKSRNRGRSESSQTGRNSSQSRSTGISLAASSGYSESESEQETHGTSEGFSESESRTEGESLSPMLMPIMKERVTSRQFKSVDEQLFEMSQQINAQKVRQCFIRLASTDIPIPILTPAMNAPLATAEFAHQITTAIITELPFVLPFATADQNVRDREKNLLSKLIAARCDREPATSRRRVQARIVNPKPTEGRGEV